MRFSMRPQRVYDGYEQIRGEELARRVHFFDRYGRADCSAIEYWRIFDRRETVRLEHLCLQICTQMMR